MAERDMERKFGVAALQAMDRDERMHHFFQAEDFYGREFEEHGIERLAIDATVSGKKKKP